MHWRVLAVLVSAPFIGSLMGHAQGGSPQPSCEVACRVNPFTAPARCACSTTGGTPTSPQPESPTPPADTPAPPPAAPANAPRPAPAPAAPGIPSCERACQVNPFTAPAGCNCGGSTSPDAAATPVASPVSPSTATPAPVTTPVASTAALTWAVLPGQTARNRFGPNGSDCRGACGPGCASVQSCESGGRYQCVGNDRVLRIQTYSCGTHQGCRIHDDCLDRCNQAGAQGVDCEAVCHLEAVKAFGIENAMSWLRGGGPYDTDRVLYEYTRSGPGMPEASYRCAEGARLECGGTSARCLAADGTEMEPVFDAFPTAGAGITLTGFQSGRLCEAGPDGPAVCEQTADIQVTGLDSCPQSSASARCTKFGVEFEYAGADPSVPLVCTASSRGSGDFVSMAVAQALSPVASQQPGSDLGAALSGLQDALRSGRSLDDVLSGISVAPLDSDGAPIESARVGGSATATPLPPTPNRVTFPTASGRLVVPMYELHAANRSGQVVEREVACTYRDTPVLETRFRLHFAGN